MRILQIMPAVGRRLIKIESTDASGSQILDYYDQIGWALCDDGSPEPKVIGLVTDGIDTFLITFFQHDPDVVNITSFEA